MADLKSSQKLRSESSLIAMKNKITQMSQKIKDEKERNHWLKEMEGLESLVIRYLDGNGPIVWDKIKPPKDDLVVRYETIPRFPAEKIKELANKLCVLKLNGGLGTTMGCTGPKSVIDVRGELNFLDLTVQQIEYMNKSTGSTVPLILMNSFNTHKETSQTLHKYKSAKLTIHSFNQSRFPRILKETLMPMSDGPECENLNDWYPPGHGDCYAAFDNSGLLDKMIAEGREYVFLSNIDNLGATVDLTILDFIIQNGCEFVMELTDKTRADVKGGTLIEYDGIPKLLEIAQVPSNKVEEFKSIKKFKVFNTNNLWVSLKAIKRVLDEHRLDDVDVIVNPKIVDGKTVIQLETAAGAAIEFFHHAKGINVSRDRFLPVKSTSDLFVTQSDIYKLHHGLLVRNPERVFPSLPLVKLGEEFKKVDGYMSRFSGIPNILELDQLTVSGDVYFGANVTLRGTVIIVANPGCSITIPDGAIIENKVITGNLHIVDH